LVLGETKDPRLEFDLSVAFKLLFDKLLLDFTAVRPRDDFDLELTILRLF
jgi:hypothetical protein